MSFLYPLFLAGIAAVSVPIVLHLVRRHTRDRVTFSSLMFLRTTLPRFTSRSRLENLPLLILRCLMLCLLALAFSRPFFSQPDADRQVRPGKRMVLLIDTSASMRRAGMFDRAITEARSVLEDVSPTDRVCIMSFDQNARTVVEFEQWQSLEPTRRAAVAVEQISELSPSWAGTVLGQALVNAAEAIQDDEVNEQQHSTGLRQIVLVSDIQQGSRLETLRTYEWPEATEVIVKPIAAEGTTNATLQLLRSRDDLAAADTQARSAVRITNSPDATTEQFGLRWADQTDPNDAGRLTDVYVAPGRSVVVNVPNRADESAGRELILTGDDHDFDNTLYLAPHLKQQVRIVYIGSAEPDDPREMPYYLRRCFDTSLRCSETISGIGPDGAAGHEVSSVGDNRSSPGGNRQPAIRRSRDRRIRDARPDRVQPSPACRFCRTSLRRLHAHPLLETSQPGHSGAARCAGIGVVRQ
ncbi:MAG: vWA domain-containing protein [Planctomycetota bacterium]|jgi:hypothetical protein